MGLVPQNLGPNFFFGSFRCFSLGNTAGKMTIKNGIVGNWAITQFLGPPEYPDGILS